MITKPTIASLRRDYATGQTDVRSLLEELRQRALEHDDNPIWIHRLTPPELEPHIARSAALDADAPLRGVPFAIKDNIDLASIPTTAACPAFGYTPKQSATVVEHLLAAGAIPLGKTNMDQFATGLVGARSPHGATRNAVNPEYIAGGSSSGSAVAVALGLAAFALGTDTAGSGRVPAAFNGIVGFKPTPGWWSTRGVVPACRSLDCVSVFTHTVADARAVADIAGGFDADDPYSRRITFAGFNAAHARFGFAQPEALPHIDAEHRALYAAFVEQLPGTLEAVDLAPFLATAELLYEGPWLAERVAAVGEFMDANPQAIHPITRAVIQRGNGHSATDCFRAQYRLAELKRQVERAFERIDVLALPTTPTTPTLADVEREPLKTNAHLGTFTNFVNLLGLCAIAIPAGETTTGLPFGVTLIAASGCDHALLNAAAILCDEQPSETPGELPLVVCGAHMAGQPLNHDLVNRGGYLRTAIRTAPHYRFYALPDGKRPALVRSSSDGAAIEAEVWMLPEAEIGGLLRTVAPPLALGSVELADGTWANGFVAEATATQGATDITAHGGWRDYRARHASSRSAKPSRTVRFG